MPRAATLPVEARPRTAPPGRRRARAAALVLSLGLLAPLGTGCAGPALAPPFAWDPGFASPGRSLTLHELSREATPAGTLVSYRIESSGFSGPKEAVLWWKRGPEFGRFAVAVSASGVVLVHPESDVFAIAEFVSGEPIDLALLDLDSEARAQVKVIPFPIEAWGPGGCSASAEIQSETGHAFRITLRGFVPGETVHVESRLGERLVVLDPVASPAGELELPLAFEPGADGEATVTAAGSRDSVTLELPVGPRALVIR